MAWAAVSSAPVRSETSGRVGGCQASFSATTRKSASMSSIRAEWKAWPTRSRRVRRPAAVSRSPAASTASSSPESTTDAGPLTAASATRSSSSGAALAGALTRLADDLRSDRSTAAEAAARRAGVLIVLPLGLCFLPAFILAGLVPVIVAVLGDVL
ncbi:hypothetical protein B0E53_06380 [Micromonospora sp. MH33]|nr:hypothetical protein B0E53_06380 [Micromonospora sp. MH33]